MLFIYAKTDRTVDHVIPLAKGGLDYVTNYKLAHNACNIDKGNMLLEDYRKMQEQRERSKKKGKTVVIDNTQNPNYQGSADFTIKQVV